MLPFVFNAEDGGNRVQDEEEMYDDGQGRQRDMEHFYQQLEEQRAQRGFNPTLANIQAQLAETQQKIQHLTEQPPPEPPRQYPDFHQPPPGYQMLIPSLPSMAPPQIIPESSSSSNGARSGERRRSRSRSPSWARPSRSSKSRSRSRSRDRNRSRERDRSRDRRRSRSRDRSSRDTRSDRNTTSSRRRDRTPPSRSRSPANNSSSSYSKSSSSRHSRRRHSRSTSRDRDRGSSRRNTSQRDQQKDRYSDWNPGVPTNKLAILNMPNDVDNSMITFAMSKCGYLPRDVRTMTKNDRVNNRIRCFAFVELPDTATAEQWMADYQGWLTLEDGRTLTVEYAKGDPISNGNRNNSDDWICAHCSMNNFVKRQTCFKCEISKDQSMELEKLGAHMVGMSPCDTLLIRGLPDGVTNSLIFDSLASLVCLSSISMIKLSDSRRFAYLQMKSSDEALMLLNLTYKTPIRIKEKDVQVSWCRDSMNRLIQQQMSMLTAGPGRETVSAAGGGGGAKTGAEIAAAAILKANAVRQASHQVGQLMAQPQVIPPNFSVPPPNLSGPPPVLQPVQPEHQNGVIGVVQTPSGVFPRYLPPNPLTFVHDPNVGYYIDPITKFCYDSATGYYFNNETARWSTWDLSYQTYFPVEQTAPPTSNGQPAEDPNNRKKSEEEGPKTAADLAKDMAKWAKKQEKDKKKVQISLKNKEAKGGPEIRNVFAQEKHKKSVLADSESDEDQDAPEAARRQKSEEPSTSAPSAHQQPQTFPRKSAIEEAWDVIRRSVYDEAKKMCILCKRAFPDVEILRKHVEKSELHRTNLEAKRAEFMRDRVQQIQEEEEKEPDLPKIVYRDRAKERRRQFGIDSTGYAFDVMGGSGSGMGSARNEDSIRRESEAASKKPLDDSNIGNRLLKSMGWKEGQGVGKHAQGIVAPIQAERFVQGAGLGSAGSKMRHGVEATHKEKTRQALYSRYHDA